MTNVSIEQAFEEACTALGEATVQQRLLAKHTAKVQAELEALQSQSATPDEAPEPGTL